MWVNLNASQVIKVTGKNVDSPEQNLDGNLDDLISLRNKYPQNPIIAYINI